MIKNENDFLGFLIKIKQNNGNISVSRILKESELNNIDCAHYLKSLQTKGYIQYMDTETYHIYPEGINAYVSFPKKLTRFIEKILIFTTKELFVFISGVASGLLVAYLVWKFGWIS